MHQPDYSISTPENVDLHLEIAGLGNRLLAQLIDGAIQLAVGLAFVLIGVIVAVAVAASGLDSKTKGILYAVIIMFIIFIIFILQNGYFLVFEAIWHGQTPGKKGGRNQGNRAKRTTDRLVGIDYPQSHAPD